MGKISIIIPFYNAEKSLKYCLESILRQSYRNYEIILVNDGSEDNSEKICLQYMKKYHNIFYIKQENLGVSSARNKGIKKATGEFIYFMDSDDVIYGNLLELIIANFTREIDCLEFNYKKIYSYNNLNIESIYDVKYDIYSREEFLYNIFNGGNGFLWNKVYRTQIIKKNKIIFDEDIFICEDMLFNIIYSNNIYKLKKINYVGYGYYQGINSSYNKKDNLKWFTVLDAYSKIIRYTAKCSKKIKDLVQYDFLYCKCEARAKNKENNIKYNGKINTSLNDYYSIISSKYISSKKKLKLIIFVMFPRFVLSYKQNKIVKGKGAC